MRVICVCLAVLAVAAPASAETWSRLSYSERTAYLVDLDTLTPVEGVATTRMARVPATGAPADQRHEVETVMVRCSDGQSRSGETITYGPDGSETDRYAEETPWEATSPTGVYGGIKDYACDNLRAADTRTWPTVAAFIADGRGQ